jgi:hypothetical protein
MHFYHDHATQTQGKKVKGKAIPVTGLKGP